MWVYWCRVFARLHSYASGTSVGLVEPIEQAFLQHHTPPSCCHPHHHCNPVTFFAEQRELIPLCGREEIVVVRYFN